MQNDHYENSKYLFLPFKTSLGRTALYFLFFVALIVSLLRFNVRARLCLSIFDHLIFNHFSKRIKNLFGRVVPWHNGLPFIYFNVCPGI